MPSKHPSAKELIRRGLYDDLQSFAKLEQRISSLGVEYSKVVGDAFEVFVEGYLSTSQKMQAETVWPVGQVPLDIRQQLNLPGDAKGIDGVFRTRTGALVPYQVKFRSQRAYLTYTELAPFLGLTERATDRIVFTNSNELAPDVKNRDAMRTVRGIDFDELAEDDFRAINGWLREQPLAIPKPSPHRYQVEALTKISDTLAKYDRAHVVMACGTGKTLVGLWTAEALKPKRVLVLLPSLTLLQQTLDEWSRHNSWGTDFTYLCVCSDPSVTWKDENDPVQLNATDLEFRVDTSPDEVRRFIERDTSRVKVVFSTYQSSSVVSQGVRGLAPFDVAIFDEAHKTTGPQGGLFAHSLKNENIRIAKRLFFTATPRHYDIRHRDKEGDFRIIAMDNETIYGPRAYTLTFGSAARQGIICNYRIVISVVDGQEVNDFALKHGITLVEGDLIGARWVANQIAIERAVEKTGAKRAITFHSRVSGAKEFSSEGTHGIRQYLPQFSVFHVNGEQRSSERKQLIRSFRDAEKALVTNARCLTEGIDVPAVDMVAFIDPRHSRIDIAQATGRAMRKPLGSDKAVGHVVVPLFLERESGETLEEALARSEMADVANVLNAMQEQDEDLVQIIRELQEAKGWGEIFDPRRLSEKIEVFGPSIELSRLRSNIFAEIVDAIGVSWDEWYGRLRTYREREGHCSVPANHKENGFRLGQWVSVQRKNASLSTERRERLDKLGFDWDPRNTLWEEGLSCLKAYREREGHCRVPYNYVENQFKLGIWVANRRAEAENVPVIRRRELDQLEFVWDPFDADWEDGFRCLTVYREREGHCRVPARHRENGFPLGTWVSNKRKAKDSMRVDHRLRLNQLGFVWDPFQVDWEEGLRHLQNYREREGNCRVPYNYVQNHFKLGKWVTKQRQNTEVMPAIRRQRLEELGFLWDPLAADWERGFSYLKAYKEREGHCRVAGDHKENGFRLGQWVGVQRAYNENLSAERRQRLDELGFVWGPFEADWQEAFSSLKAYKEREGHCRVPHTHIENDFQLGKWVTKQRSRREALSVERQRRLDELGFVWDAREAAWESGFSYMEIYKIQHGDCHVPMSYEENGFRLGQWIGVQRKNGDIMSEERRRRLGDLGFIWNSLEADWEECFSNLQVYKEREGHCCVSGSHVENGCRLGVWVDTQRQSKRKGRLSQERIQRLDELGFDWSPRSAAWEKGFSYLKLYQERAGDCRVPQNHIENGYPLGQWVNNQRQNKDGLSEERLQILNALGFVWKARRTRPRSL